jgi:hypothetical protein
MFPTKMKYLNIRKNGGKKKTKQQKITKQGNEKIS